MPWRARGAVPRTKSRVPPSPSRDWPTLFDEVVGRLRHELPELIDQVLREHFEQDLKDD